MAHFKILFHGPFGDNEAIVEADDAEAAQAKFETEMVEDGTPRKVASVEAYTPTYGQTLVMGVSRSGYGGVFGYGDDLDKAKAAFRKNGGALGRGYEVIVFDAETDFIGVTPMGMYRWLGNQPTTTSVAPTAKAGAR